MRKNAASLGVLDARPRLVCGSAASVTLASTDRTTLSIAVEAIETTVQWRSAPVPPSWVAVAIPARMNEDWLKQRKASTRRGCRSAKARRLASKAVTRAASPMRRTASAPLWFSPLRLALQTRTAPKCPLKRRFAAARLPFSKGRAANGRKGKSPLRNITAARRRSVPVVESCATLPFASGCIVSDASETLRPLRMVPIRKVLREGIVPNMPIRRGRLVPHHPMTNRTG